MDQTSLRKIYYQKREEIFATEAESMRKLYDTWATTYDGSMDAAGYDFPLDSTKILMEYLTPNEDNKVLDVACGTGLAGKALRNAGFKGILHGVDGSEEMLKVAQSNHIYDHVFCQFISPERDIATVAGMKYDGVTCIRSIGANHLDVKILPSLANLLKPNGIMVYSIRQGKDLGGDTILLEEETQNLIESGCVDKLEVSQYKHKNMVVNDDDSTIEGKESRSIIYCCRKVA